MSRTEYFVFKEGWATYAEDPVLRRDLQEGNRLTHISHLVGFKESYGVPLRTIY